MQRSSSQQDMSSLRNDDRSKRLKQQFKCGESKCSKLYHSYTAFYNHCKKAHSGQFPSNSLLNGQVFQGPTKNRGRPRMKKNEVKNQFQIQSMKAENQLIEFLGTIRLGTNKASQELISYVEDPLQRLKEAVQLTKEMMKQRDQKGKQYLDSLLKINQIICSNDLPQFYDPIEHEKYKDKVDSYNFNSIYRFFKKRNDQGLKIQWILICWLTRILSLKLLAETIYTLYQIEDNERIEQVDFYQNKSAKFKNLVTNYIKYVELQHDDQQDQ